MISLMQSSWTHLSHTHFIQLNSVSSNTSSSYVLKHTQHWFGSKSLLTISEQVLVAGLADIVCRSSITVSSSLGRLSSSVVVRFLLFIVLESVTLAFLHCLVARFVKLEDFLAFFLAASSLFLIASSLFLAASSFF